MKKSKLIPISLPKELIDEVELLINENKLNDFKNVKEFIIQAIKKRLKDLSNDS